MRRCCLLLALIALPACKKHKEEVVTSPDGAAPAAAGKPDASSASVASAPGEHASEAECRQAFRNGTALMMAKELEGQSPLERGRLKMMMKDHLGDMEEKSVKACVSQAPRDEVMCTIRAKTLAEVAHCQGQELSDAGVGGPPAKEADCKGLSKVIDHILDSDPAVKQIPPDQLKALRESLSDIDKRCVGMPLDVLGCMRGATTLAALVQCSNASTSGPPTP